MPALLSHCLARPQARRRWLAGRRRAGAVLLGNPVVRCPPVGEQPLACGQQALGAEDHDQHQGDAEDEVLVLGDGGEAQRNVADQGTAEDGPDLVACATEHHRCQEQDGGGDVELLVVHEAHLAGEQGAGETADGCPDGERPDLVLEGGHAHDLGGVFVLPDGDPGPADPAALEVADQQQ